MWDLDYWVPVIIGIVLGFLLGSITINNVYTKSMDTAITTGIFIENKKIYSITEIKKDDVNEV